MSTQREFTFGLQAIKTRSRASSVYSECVLGVLGSPAFPGNRIDDLIRAAKQRPGEMSYASAGVGTLPHLAAELLKQRLGLDMIHVPFEVQFRH